MACGCAKSKEKTCENCVLGAKTDSHWVNCGYWTNSEETPVVRGQYTRYTNGSVRTKKGSTCDHYTTQALVDLPA